jgi:phosphohistidine phosphatase
MTLKQPTGKNKLTGNSGARLLCLVRHGEAAPKDVGLDDFERPLTAKGNRECEKVARKLHKAHASFNLLISSPADRALETAHIFAAELEYPIQQIQIIDSLYTAHSPSEIVTIIKKIDESTQSVALFGHNPMFSELASYFVGDFNHSVAKGAAVGIKVYGLSWNEISRHRGSLEFYLPPDTKRTHLKRAH